VRAISAGSLFRAEELEGQRKKTLKKRGINLKLRSAAQHFSQFKKTWGKRRRGGGGGAGTSLVCGLILSGCCTLQAERKASKKKEREGKGVRADDLAAPARLKPNYLMLTGEKRNKDKLKRRENNGNRKREKKVVSWIALVVAES